MPKNGTELLGWKPKSMDGRRIMSIRFDSRGGTLFAFFEKVRLTAVAATKFWSYGLDTKEERRFEGTHSVVDGRMTNDRKYVVTWDGSGDIAFWDIETSKEVDSLRVARQHVYDVTFSPAGDVMATAGDDNVVKFWSVHDRTQLITKEKFTHEGIDLVKFSSTGRLMLTGSDDGWLRCWDAPEFCRDRRNSKCRIPH